MKSAMLYALYGILFSLFILSVMLLTISGIDRAADRRERKQDTTIRKHYTEWRDMTIIPKKYIGQTSYSTLAGDD